MIDPETIVFVCRHVLERERSVELLVHHSDGSWQATCGQYDHPTEEPDIHPVHLHHLTGSNPDLMEVAADTAPGYYSEWAEGRWQQVAHDD